ncbi:V-type proton ATPase subunit E [Diplonema papillatum]|nr:V-type proton ATPase subunit E [Diplonema papillatum]
MDPTRQIEQMKQFIISEANEKAEEIKTKADNEAYAWKNESSKRMKEEIDRQCQKEIEQHRISLRVAHANKLKKQRDAILESRTEAMTELKQAAKDNLQALVGKGAEYNNLLLGLLKQAAVAVQDPTGTTQAVVRCRKQDKSFIEKNLSAIKDVELSVSDDFLPDTAIGGVTVSAQRGAIVCDNTLSSRLANCMEEVMPILRDGLFQ